MPKKFSSDYHAHKADHGFTLLELLVALFIISILLMLAIPIYQEYQTRAKIAEGFGFVSHAKNVVTEYYLVNGTFPTNNSQAALPVNPRGISGNWLSSLTILSNPAGAIKLTFEIPTLGSKNSIVIRPIFTRDNFEWDCRDQSAGSIENQYRPRSCRTD